MGLCVILYLLDQSVLCERENVSAGVYKISSITLFLTYISSNGHLSQASDFHLIRIAYGTSDSAPEPVTSFTLLLTGLCGNYNHLEFSIHPVTFKIAQSQGFRLMQNL